MEMSDKITVFLLGPQALLQAKEGWKWGRTSCLLPGGLSWLGTSKKEAVLPDWDSMGRGLCAA